MGSVQSEKVDQELTSSNAAWSELIKNAIMVSENNAELLNNLAYSVKSLLEQFIVLVQNSCIITNNCKDIKEHITFDKLMCQTFGLQDETAVAIIQDNSYLDLIRNTSRGQAVECKPDIKVPGCNETIKREDFSLENVPADDFMSEDIKYEIELPDEVDDIQPEEPKKVKRKKKTKGNKRQENSQFSKKYNPAYLVDKESFALMLDKKIPWTCPKCALNFKSLDCLTIHWKKRVCQKKSCYKRTKFVGARKSEGSPAPIYFCKHQNCSGSNEEFKYNIQVLKHWQDNHFGDVDDIVVCEEQGCGEQFIALPLLTLHTSNKHRRYDETFSCQHCGWMTKDKRTLAFHESRHKAEKTIGCDLCDYKTNVERNLIEHVRRRHTNKCSNRATCELCGKFFRDASALKEHYATHNNVQDPAFQCKICGKFLKQQNSYSKHMMNVHKMGFTCALCEKIFYTQKMLQIHKRDKHGVAIDMF